jgi:ankyrin repeat protein
MAPRGLRDQRREPFSRVLHGDTPGVPRLLDAGLDPRVRDVRRFTLLHVLHYLDWPVLLPRLLADGLDLEALDYQKRTPLHIARQKGPADLVSALIAAGARTDAWNWNWEDDD